MNSNFDPRPVKLSKKIPTVKKERPETEDKAKAIVGPINGRKIMQARNAMQLKQKDLAIKTSFPLDIILKWERGEAVFEKKIAERIEKVLKIKFE